MPKRPASREPWTVNTRDFNNAPQSLAVTPTCCVALQVLEGEREPVGVSEGVSAEDAVDVKEPLFVPVRVAVALPEAPTLSDCEGVGTADVDEDGVKVDDGVGLPDALPVEDRVSVPLPETLWDDVGVSDGDIDDVGERVMDCDFVCVAAGEAVMLPDADTDGVADPVPVDDRVAA